MNVTVIGLGLIGGSVALDLKGRKFADRVTGVDSNPDHTREALALGLVDRVESLENAVPEADLVILAIPVGAMIRILPEILDRIGPSGTVTDLGSTKVTICRAIENHPRRGQFVPSHPMAGTENSGPSAAKKGLFDGKIAVICDHGAIGAAHQSRVETMYRTLGMKIVAMTPADHDLHTAYVSHLSHVSSFVLANAVLEKEKNVETIFDLAGGGFESTVRLAKSSPAMWGPILEQNRENVAAALGTYIRQLEDFREALVAKNFKRLDEIMNDANRIRRVLAGLGNRTERRQ